MWLNLIPLILRALVAYLETKSTEATIKLKRLVLDEDERIEEEYNEITQNIVGLRTAGKHSQADRLRQRLVRRAVFRTTLPTEIFNNPTKSEDTDSIGNLHTPDKGDLGKFS